MLIKKIIVLILILVAFSCKNETKNLSKNNIEVDTNASISNPIAAKDTLRLKKIEHSLVKNNSSSLPFYYNLKFEDIKIEFFAIDLNIYSIVSKNKEVLKNTFFTNHQIDFFNVNQIQVFKLNNEIYKIILPSISDETEIINTISIVNKKVNISEYKTTSTDDYYNFIDKNKSYNKQLLKIDQDYFVALEGKNYLILNDEYKTTIDKKDIAKEILKIEKSFNLKTISNTNALWKGIYSFSIENIAKMDEVHSIFFNIKVEDNIVLTTTLDNNQPIFNHGQILKTGKDSLIFNLESKKNKYYITKDKKNNFYISGHDIYMLNPPNDKYLIKRKEL